MRPSRTGFLRLAITSVSFSGCWLSRSWIFFQPVRPQFSRPITDFGFGTIRRRRQRGCAPSDDTFVPQRAGGQRRRRPYLSAQRSAPSFRPSWRARHCRSGSDLIGASFPDLPRVSLLELDNSGGSSRAFLAGTVDCRRLIRRSGADVLLSAGNFALRKSPVPQICSRRNSLYTSTDFLRDLRHRRAYGLWLDTRLKRQDGSTLHRAGRTAPSLRPRPSHRELRQWTGRDVIAIHHGFDREAFFRDHRPLEDSLRTKAGGRLHDKDAAAPALRQPLQLLPEFRDAVSRAARAARAPGWPEGKTLSHLPVSAPKTIREATVPRLPDPWSRGLASPTAWWNWGRFRIQCCTRSIAHATFM